MTWFKKHFTIIRLGFSSFLNDLSSEMILPILPLLIEHVGGSGIALGLIGGLRDSGTEIFNAIFGRLSDKIGKRKVFIYSGYITSSFFKLLIAFATSWEWIFTLVGFERIGKALRTSPRDAMIAQSLPGQVGKGFGIHRFFDAAGAIMGSLVAFYLIWEWNLSLTTIVMIAAIISFMSIIPLATIQEAIPTTPNGTDIAPATKLPSSFKLFAAIGCIFSLANISYMFFIVHAQTILANYSPVRTSMLLYVLFTIFYTMGAIPFGILSDKIGRWKMVLIGYTLFAIIQFGFLFAQSINMLIICFVLYGFALAIIKVNHKAFAADLAPHNLKATALGTFESMTGLTLLGTGVITGSLWEIVGHQAVFLYSGVVALLACLMLLMSKKYIAR